MTMGTGQRRRRKRSFRFVFDFIGRQFFSRQIASTQSYGHLYLMELKKHYSVQK